MENRKYHAPAVPASDSRASTAKLTCAPNSNVTGTIGMPNPRTEVLAIRLTPAGTLSCALNSGLLRWVTERAACASIHTNSWWSWPSPISRRFGCTHRRAYTHRAPSR